MIDKRPTVVLAGASGFVGSSLRENLRADYDLIALTRSTTRASTTANDKAERWIRCDLFSLREMTDALKGADYAIYLVHSMLPSSRLNQSNFEDLDLLLADNFARAAAASGVKRLIYLGGLQPEASGERSGHLRSRDEVEQTLRSYPTPVTVLRAGIIVGPGGSSLRMLVNLVRRLPVMLLPRWLHSRTYFISIDDVVRAFEITLKDSSFAQGSYDIGYPEPLTYGEMIQRCAAVLGRRRFFIPIPIRSTSISKLWIQLFSGSPRSLTGPLVDSLKHDLDLRPNPLQEKVSVSAEGFEDALKRSIDDNGQVLPNQRERTQKQDNKLIREARRVRSVQRVHLPHSQSAAECAEVYFEWLGRFFKGLVRVDMSGNDRDIRLFGLKAPLLSLRRSEELSSEHLDSYYIVGGLLADANAEALGRFEFRQVLGGKVLLTAIHGYRPRLPWLFYNATQAVLHLWVMKAFGRYMRRDLSE